MGTTKITVRRKAKKKDGTAIGTVFMNTTQTIIPESSQKLKVHISGENRVRYVAGS